MNGPLPPYIVYHSDFNATEKSHTYIDKDSKKIIKKFQLYCVFLHHEAEKMKQTNCTQMRNRKSTCTFTTAYFCIMKQKKWSWQIVPKKEYK